MQSIVSTTVGSVMARSRKISTKKKSIKAVKDEAYDLIDVEDLMSDFTSSYASKLNNFGKVFKSLTYKQKVEINKAISDLKFLTKEIMIKSLINSNIEGLSCYLARLKVTMLTKDLSVSKKIMKKFTTQKDMNIGHVGEEIKDFKKKISLLEKRYKKFIDVINASQKSLEHKLHLEYDGLEHIEKLKDLNHKQRELLYHIGKNFVTVSRSIICDKDCRKKLREKF